MILRKKKVISIRLFQLLKTNKVLLISAILATSLAIVCYLHTFEEIIDLKSEKTIKRYPSHKQPLLDNQDKFTWSPKYKLWSLIDPEHNSDIFNAHDDQNELVSDIWSQNQKFSDRIIEQLLFNKEINKIHKIKPPQDQYYQLGAEHFKDCPVNNCEITYENKEADALLFLNSDVIDDSARVRRPDQVWIAYFLESPSNTFDTKFSRLKRGKHVFNLTASYRSDSDLTTPYSKFVPYSSKLERYLKLKSATKTIEDRRKLIQFNQDQGIGKIETKAGKVAWFVSNCNAENNRLEYAKELAKYIQVDIYGKCGNLTCQKWNETGCFEMINRNYKYYLSFENSNCREYITEKFFKNALGYNDPNYRVVPIVMGAPRQDYELIAPPGSFIHVNDFKNPKDLASYLKLLNHDNSLYSTYFQWKKLGKFIDTKFMCRLCAMLQDTRRTSKEYTNIKEWWLYYKSVKCCK